MPAPTTTRTTMRTVVPARSDPPRAMLGIPTRPRHERSCSPARRRGWRGRTRSRRRDGTGRGLALPLDSPRCSARISAGTLSRAHCQPRRIASRSIATTLGVPLADLPPPVDKPPEVGVPGVAIVDVEEQGGATPRPYSKRGRGTRPGSRSVRWYRAPGLWSSASTAGEIRGRHLAIGFSPPSRDAREFDGRRPGRDGGGYLTGQATRPQSAPSTSSHPTPDPCQRKQSGSPSTVCRTASGRPSLQSQSKACPSRRQSSRSQAVRRFRRAIRPPGLNVPPSHRRRRAWPVIARLPVPPLATAVNGEPGQSWPGFRRTTPTDAGRQPGPWPDRSSGLGSKQTGP